MFPGNLEIGKIATDLTTQAIMKTQSKYLKQGPVPVGNYQPPRDLQTIERYGSNRRLNRPQRKIQGKSSLNTQSADVQDSASQTSNKKGSEGVNSRILQNSRASHTTQISEPSNPIKQQSTPQAVRKTATLTYTNQNQTPKPAVQNDFISDMFSNNGNVKPTRYGANRRTVQSQKAEEIIEKYETQAKAVTKVQTIKNHFDEKLGNRQEQIKRNAKGIILNLSKKGNDQNNSNTEQKELNQVKTQPSVQPSNRSTTRSRVLVSKTAETIQAEQAVSVSHYQTTPTSSRFNRQVITPKRSGQQQEISQFNHVTETTPTSEQPSQSGNMHKPLSRSSTRNQLKSKLETPVLNKVENNEENVVDIVRKRSNIILFALKNIFKVKISESFNTLKKNCIAVEKKEKIFAKIFARKLSSWQSRAEMQKLRISFCKILKLYSISMAKPDQKTKQRIISNVRIMLPSSVHRRYTHTIADFFGKLKKIVVQNNRSDALIKQLHKLQLRKICNVYQSIRNWVQYRYNAKKVVLANVLTISRISNLRCYYFAFRKIHHATNTQQKPIKPQKGSPIHQFDRDLSSIQTPQQSPQKNSKQVQQIQTRLNQNNKNLQDLQTRLSKQKQQHKAKLQRLQTQCEELQMQNEEKKKTTEELKQKTSEIQYQEEDYIQGSDVLLIDTRFPILYEAYVKVEKSVQDKINIDDLKHVFQACADEVNRTKSVQEWAQVLKNAELMRQIAVYQGQQEVVRKAVKVGMEQQQLLMQLVRGYIKQKYTWEWVKNAIGHLGQN